MRIFKRIIKNIIAIFLTIATIIYITINLLSSTILSKEYVINKIEEIGYYDKIYESVESNFENYIYQSGLDENALENIVSKEKIREDTNLILNNIYDGAEKEIDVQEIEDNLNKNIETSLGNQRLNATQQKSIETFVEQICNEYKDTISNFNYENQIYNAIAKIRQVIELGKKVVLITIIVCVILIIVLSLKRLYRVLMYLGVSLVASGTFFVIVNLFINANTSLQHILILNDTISEVLRNILSDILSSELNTGLIMLGIGFVSILISNIVHSRRKYRYEKHMEENYEYE